MGKQDTINLADQFADQLVKLHEVYGEDPTDLSRLHPDLRAALRPGPIGGLMIHHPLLMTIIPTWKLANNAYEHKKEQLATYEREGEWERAIWLYERPYRLSKLAEYVSLGHISLSEQPDVLLHLWADTEYPWQFGDLPLTLFRAAGYVTDNPDLDRASISRSVLYRGVNGRGKARGLSWTLSLEKAEWFARRFLIRGQGGRVYQARLTDESAVLAYIKTRNEEEVVIDPKKIRKVGLLSRVYLD